MPRTIADWASDCARLSGDDFATQHPGPYLVQEREPPDEAAAADELRFATLDASSPLPDLEAVLGPASLAGLEVLAVRRRDGSGLEGMVNVGRAENCDLVLPFASVSKFHAFFTSDPVSGVPQVVDADSTNGTFVNGQRLIPHEREALGPRDLIGFGADAVYRFHSALTFHELVRLAS